jgi:hypothetical protein
MENAGKGMGYGKSTARNPLRRTLQTRMTKPVLTRKF